MRARTLILLRSKRDRDINRWRRRWAWRVVLASQTATENLDKFATQPSAFVKIVKSECNENNEQLSVIIRPGEYYYSPNKCYTIVPVAMRSTTLAFISVVAFIYLCVFERICDGYGYKYKLIGWRNVSKKISTSTREQFQANVQICSNRYLLTYSSTMKQTLNIQS